MGKQKTAAIVAIAITNILIMMALTPISAILPTIAGYFAVDVTTASWVVTSFLLSLTGFLLICGRLGDLYGHTRVFVVGLVVYTIVGTICGFVQDIGVLIALRAVQGLGAAMVSGNSLAIVTHVFTMKERGTAIGVAGTSASFGGLLGVMVSTMLAQYLNWQWLFYVTLPLGLVGIKAALDLKADFRPKEPPKVDVLGAVLLPATLTAFSLSLSHLHPGEASFASGWYYHGGLLAATVVTLVLFVVAEMRAPQPVVDLRYLRNGSFSFSIIANEILHMTMMASVFLMPFLLERGLGYPPVFTAGVIIVTSAGNMAAAPLSGLLYDRTRSRFLCPIAMCFIFLGLGLMAVVAPRAPYWQIMIVGLVLGLGLGVFMTPNNTIIMNSVPAHLRGFAAGMLETSRQLGHTLGVAAASAVLVVALASVAPGTPQTTAYTIGYEQATLAASGIAFLGILAALVHPLSRKASRAAQEVADTGVATG